MKETKKKKRKEKKTETPLTYRIVLFPGKKIKGKKQTKQRKPKTRKVDTMNVQLRVQATTESALRLQTTSKPFGFHKGGKNELHLEWQRKHQRPKHGLEECKRKQTERTPKPKTLKKNYET